MTTSLSLNRRDFLAASALLAGGAILPISVQGVTGSERIPYEPTLQDRLWMWGHETDTIQGHYGIPKGREIFQADGCNYLGIPNDCVAVFRQKPKPPFHEFAKQFTSRKRVGWGFLGCDKQVIKGVLELAETFPKLTTLFLDDFFYPKKLTANQKEGEAPAWMSVEELKAFREKIHAMKNPLDLAIVVYSHELKRPAIKQHLDQCDIISFWTWTASDLSAVEKNFAMMRTLAPTQRVLLGIYMWDFGRGKPISVQAMEHQCNYALQLFKEKQIEGMVFHCTPLCGLDLEAVEFSKEWIAKNAKLVVAMSR